MTPRLLIPAGLALLLSACGFHLRGLGASTPLAFASLNVTAPAGGLGDVLGRQLSLRPDLKLLAAKDAQQVIALQTGLVWRACS